MSRDIYTVVRRPLLTEKNMKRVEKRGEYTFEVDLRANKIEIRQAIEKLYSVRVTRVNTVISKGLARRFAWNWSMGSDVKRAIVKLREGDKIDLL